MLKARDIINKNIVTVKKDTPIFEAVCACQAGIGPLHY